MIQFNDLQFLTSKTLRINAEVIDLEYYNSVYIDSIIIDTEDTVCETGPSSDPPFSIDIEGSPKSVNMTLDVSTLLANGPKMLFVYVRCAGVPYPEPPCGLDNQDTMMPVVDYSTIYDKALAIARCNGKCGCVDGNCEIDTQFANFALQYFRLKEALGAKRWSDAYDAYCWLMHKTGNVAYKTSSAKGGCGCNG